MRRQRSESEQQIADLLQTARKSLRLSVAFLSRMDGTTQHLEVVDSSIPLVFHDGITQKQETTSSSPSSTSSPAPGSARRPSAGSPRTGARPPTSASPRPTASARATAWSCWPTTDPVLSKLVRSLVDFGHGCDVRVVAEGVETAAEHAVLRALGVDLGQGWLFGRPGPASALADGVIPSAPSVPAPRAAPVATQLSA